MKLPSQGDMVTAILHHYVVASPAQKRAGRDWYPAAGRIVEQLAELTGTDVRRFAHALAALSPRNPWRWNVADAYSYAVAKNEGRMMPTATTFRKNQNAAWRALEQDETPWLTAAPKVYSFVDAIMGDTEAVVVDMWAVRAATNGLVNRVHTKAQYKAVADAYKAAADMIHAVNPRDLQAIVWLHIRAEKLAITNHVHVYKAGTHEHVKAVLDA